MIAVSRSRHKSPLCTVLGMENICTAVDIPIHQTFYILGIENISIEEDTQTPRISYTPMTGNTYIKDVIPTLQTSYSLSMV